MTTHLPTAHYPRFHLAFPVTDLAQARRFYGDFLGCAEGRSSDEWVDFDFHGHQIVAHKVAMAGMADAIVAAGSAGTPQAVVARIDWARFLPIYQQVGRRSLLAEVANRYYQADPRPYLVLTIDLDRVAAPWRYDAAGEDYPHIYGPLPRRAVLASAPMSRADDGACLHPDDPPM